MTKILTKKTSLKRKAFSLIELSIVIVVVSILVAAGLATSVSSINSNRVKITNERIDVIYKALGVFLIKEGRLPCPASLRVIKTNSAYGAEGVCASGATPAANTGIYQSSTVTDLFYGMVPAAALGLSNDAVEDAWGNKFTYIINYNLTTAASFGSASITNFLTIREVGSAVQNDIISGANGAAFVIISHGANKSGAFNASSSTQNTRATNNEAENDANIGASTGGQVAFDQNIVYSSGEDTFDDIVFYKSRRELVNDFNMLSLMVCPSTSLSLYGGTVFYWPASKYGQVVSAALGSPSVPCPATYNSGKGTPKYPTRRCGAFGVWSDIINPCVSYN